MYHLLPSTTMKRHKQPSWAGTALLSWPSNKTYGWKLRLPKSVKGNKSQISKEKCPTGFVDLPASGGALAALPPATNCISRSSTGSLTYKREARVEMESQAYSSREGDSRCQIRTDHDFPIGNFNGAEKSYPTPDRENIQPGCLRENDSKGHTCLRHQLSPKFGKREDWEMLQSLRTKTRRSRSKLARQRKVLREKRSATEQADKAFMKCTRAIRPIHKAGLSRQIDDELEEYYDALQEARNEYGSLEDEFLELEDALDEDEFEMAKIENRLYSPRGWEPGFSETVDDSRRSLKNETLVPGISPFLGLHTGERPAFHPLVVKYHTKLGELDLAREEYDGLVQEREELLARQESRSHVGLDLHEDARKILESLPAREAELLARIEALEVEADELRNNCLQEALDLGESDDGSGFSLHSDNDCEIYHEFAPESSP